MTKDEIKRNAQKLFVIFGVVEAVGWILVVLPLTKTIHGPAAAISLAFGICLVIACLTGAIWTAIQLAKLQ